MFVMAGKALFTLSKYKRAFESAICEFHELLTTLAGKFTL
jgi:hypothetical protein